MNQSPIEQVGFIEPPERTKTLVELYEPQGERLVMMGGELCINATLAYAAQIGGSGQLFLGDGQAVNFSNYGQASNLELALPYTRSFSRYALPIVLFETIGYEVGLTWAEARRRRDQLPNYCREYGLPAFGFIAQKGLSIEPLVYVAATQTTTPETACGSGSIAAYIAGQNWIESDMKERAFVQPTQELISVQQVAFDQNRPVFKVSALVEKVPEIAVNPYNKEEI
jgi:hypothetical protein